MGTNYYMMTKSKKLVERYFPYEYEIVDTPYFGYEIHIGKRSCGWKPLFQEHKNAYDSVTGMKEFIKKHQKSIHIFDEYCREFTLEQLEDELINWGEQQEIRYMKHIPDGVPDEVFGVKNIWLSLQRMIMILRFHLTILNMRNWMCIEIIGDMNMNHIIQKIKTDTTL